MSRTQVTVVGGGLVGSTAALGLARAGFDVSLIERSAPHPNRGALGVDIRNVALSPASAELLDEVGAWRDVDKAPYDRMVVWEQWGSGRVVFEAAEVGRAELGWVVEMSPLVCALWSAVEQHPGINIELAQLQEVGFGSAGVELCFVGGETSTTEFVIAADGARSLIRQALDVPLVEKPMDQVALATAVRTEMPHENTAWQRFSSGGPLAFLPAPDPHVCSVVWSQTAEQAQQLMALNDQTFCREIARALEHQLGAVTSVDKRFTFPLTQQRVTNCAPRPEVLLLGDAMRVIHPLAGQGVNLGLEDVAQMLKVARSHENLCDPRAWQHFAHRRAARSEAMIRVMGGLHKLYTSTDPLLGLLRNTGARSFNALAVLKGVVMREAMGLAPATK